MKQISLLFGALLLLNACAAIEHFTDYAKENDVVIKIAISQGILRYIDAGDDKQWRAQSVINKLNEAEAVLADDATTTVSVLFSTLNNKINWKDMSKADEVLVKEILVYVQTEVKEKLKTDELSPEAVVTLKGILGTAKTYAAMYL